MVGLFVLSRSPSVSSIIHSAMESAKNLELIDQAMQKFLQENRNKEDPTLKDDNDQLLLSKLLSELESLKRDDGELDQSESSSGKEAPDCPAAGDVESKNEKDVQADRGGSENSAAEEIVKELRIVRRQNFVTHCLLSAMIVLTVAWQLSEVTLIWQVRHGLIHPFRSLGNMLTGWLKHPADDGKDAERQQEEVIPVQVPPLKVPELPHIDFGSNGEDHS